MRREHCFDRGFDTLYELLRLSFLIQLDIYALDRKPSRTVLPTQGDFPEISGRCL